MQQRIKNMLTLLRHKYCMYKSLSILYCAKPRVLCEGEGEQSKKRLLTIWTAGTKHGLKMLNLHNYISVRNYLHKSVRVIYVMPQLHVFYMFQ